ncbi:MAG: heme-copper oxidase subunit III [Winogradskyella sp.]|uniref:cytochrome c oxidase subunit 3 n=1 Tax=Winogradskyella sp. TaxID=1883156 RepID=UPI00183FB687|nr:cytochrome c oxidase subunit 3 [Winogradskyella sp.]MBT8244990.1 cytochrome c oxidase subunit 3 [Winogradskyella sp.]NNK22168.1 heme-copper oxidase subunit III [Winogradskyella sp.]
MDLTEGTQEEKQIRSKKMMLWFAIGSLIMTFAALTSAFIVSRKREDWLNEFELPQPFLISVFVIIISSITMILAKRAMIQNNRSQTTMFLLVTFALGVFFILNQFQGFSQFIAQGYNFTGPTSNVTISFIYVIAVVHIAHVIGALISLLVVIYQHLKQKYSPENMLGIELAAHFWHFVDILWVCLFLFLYFFRYII